VNARWGTGPPPLECTGRPGRDSQFWGVHGGLSAAGVSAGTTEVGNQSSLGGSESLVTGVGICIFACSSGFASFPRHGGEKHRGGEREMVVWVDVENMQRENG
jgi:hypothetical protein